MGAYHLADKISNTFYSFPLIIFYTIILILPLDIKIGCNANSWGSSHLSIIGVQAERKARCDCKFECFGELAAREPTEGRLRNSSYEVAVIVR
jgi:hypothetical protein